jgi:putrescine aminotransferase
LLAASSGIPFGDLVELERALRKRSFAAFVVEPIQAEGGVVVPPSGYLKEAQALCRRYGTLLVLDEIQTGLGRTGTFWGFDAEGFVPDIIAIAKALSGGIAPIAATITSREIHSKAYGSIDRFDLHGSTFAGNALGAVAALETLKILDEEDLSARSATLGYRLLSGLRQQLSGHPLVQEVRGRGLLVGIELGPTNAGWLNGMAPGIVDKISEKVFGQWIAFKLLEKGMLCQPASHRWNVIRLEPPLTIGETEIDQIVRMVSEVMDEYRDIGRLLHDVAGRVGRQWLRGWAF